MNKLPSYAVQQIIADANNAVCFAWERVSQGVQVIVDQYGAPSVLFRPKLSRDGNQWCVLYGDNLQDGIAGFGDSPALAMSDFDKNWFVKLNQRTNEPAA